MNDQKYNPIDLEVDFNRQMLDVLFQNPAMKKIKIALSKNNFNKLKPLIIKSSESIIHNCLLYSIHHTLDKICKKMIRTFYLEVLDKKLDINKNNSEIFKFYIYYFVLREKNGDLKNTNSKCKQGSNKTTILELLLQLNVDVTVGENYAFIQCCELNNCYLVKLLMDKGADVYARNSFSIVEASGKGYVDLVKLLLTKMENHKLEDMQARLSSLAAKDNLGDKEAGYTEYYYPTNYDIALISAAKSNHVEIISLLMDAGANASINNWEILMKACENGNDKIVSICLNHGANPNMLDGLLIKKSIQFGHYNVVETLINHLCDLSIDNSAALRWACYKGNYDIVKLLLESKNPDGTPQCDIGAENNDALRLATKFGHDSIVSLLNDYSKRMHN